MIQDIAHGIRHPINADYPPKNNDEIRMTEILHRIETKQIVLDAKINLIMLHLGLKP